MGYHMDKHIILEFDKEQKAQTCLSVINQLAAAYWESQGYTVLDTPEGKALVGKNAATGQDMPDSEKTITWDEIRLSPDNTYYFLDPAASVNYSLWLKRATALGYVFDGVQREMPSEWEARE